MDAIAYSQPTPAPSMQVSEQMQLWADHPVAEDPRYLTDQLITYIGNKRSLLSRIAKVVEHVKTRLGKDRLRLYDGFSGSGVVSRLFKAHASFLASNDLEDYAGSIARCYLRNRSSVDLARLQEAVADINAMVEQNNLPPGFIEELYSPRDEDNIGPDERVFYTRENARRLDNYRRLLDRFDEDLKTLLLGPLLSKASVHANTAGVFKGFYKNRHTGIGCYGGTSNDALKRIKGRIMMEVPVLSRFECEVRVLQEDANRAVREVGDLDLAYFDPPYNQHPYGSNYFMLNLLVHYRRPGDISKISGIPTDWRRSGYNVRSKAFPLMRDLVQHTDARFILISFNNEGFISPDEMTNLLHGMGRVELVEVPYNTFRGCRNLRNRQTHVTEQLFLVERR